MHATSTVLGRESAPMSVFAPSDCELSAPRTGSAYSRLRSVAELAITLVLLVPAAAVVLLAATLVRLTSRGPALFTQTRLGLDGREFVIYKLRSMTHDCERHSGAVWSEKGDARVTPVGRFLRRLHIDELPQLWNVLRGDMSLIGPRPERPEFVAKLEFKVPRYRERLQVRPGVTGLAQVQLPPDSDEAEVWRKQAYDLYYISTMSPWLDVRILMCTALKIFCIPFSILGKVLGMPRESAVYDSYWGSPMELDEFTSEAVPQPTTA